MSSSTGVDEFLSTAEAFILSGGAAARAGGMNKSFIQVEGRAIVEHQLERLRPLFETRITAITDRGPEYDHLGIPTLPDFEPVAPPDRFPLRGFARALTAASGWTFILAADMPWPDPSVIRAQVQRLIDSTHLDPKPQGLVLAHDDRLQPFHAFYHSALAPSSKRALEGDDRSLKGWIRSEPSIHVCEAMDMFADADAIARALRGFNSPPS